MSTPTSLPPAGWYPDPDPAGAGRVRWWDGAAWSSETRRDEQASPEPQAQAAAPAQSAAPAQPQPEPTPQPQTAPPAQAQAAPIAPTPPSYPQSYPGGYYPQGYPGAQPAPGYPGAPSYPGGPSHYPGAPAYAPGMAAPSVAAPIGVWRSPVDDRPAVRGMGGAIRTVFGKYAKFDGRASRPEFWFWALFETIIIAGLYISIIATAAAAVAGSDNPLQPIGVLPAMFAMLTWLWIAATALPGWAVTVRRLRDAGFHWAFIFLLVVPFAGDIAVLIMCGQPSKHP